MNAYITLLILVTEVRSGIAQSEVYCNGTNMTPRMRSTVEYAHNSYRATLAKGKAGGYPKASNMSYLFYSCDFENKALDIAKLNCNHTSHLNFNYVGSNNATFTGRYLNTTELVAAEAVIQWWNTGKLHNPPQNLTPSENNTSEIPFLQMVNGATTRIGCAFHICQNGCHPFVSFVCTYGPAHVKFGVPLYTIGRECAACGGKRNKSCLGRSLCNNSVV
ncbi:hypothetical protein KIN20_009761 [Parelaphostrongylus tenuis]|uniref:SCP domain-containing protein n=1 Tax=Parelaphostrongylus tenuis TaxID=148309 RepID=A0AAD5QLG8_PARTN|nr:hypothetical protein KIN20_009761 [Parelaphostrongylus tenuis]